MHDLDQIMHKAYLWDVQRQAARFAKPRGLTPGRWRAPRRRAMGLAVLLAAVGLATLASLLPAWRAARLKPAETIRVEQ